MPKFDILIKNGFIVDGTGKPAFKASVGVRDERIALVGEVSSSSSDIVIDAKGLTVSPGFIDAHSHADKTLLFYPTADSYVRQGVTTTVGGNCGNTPAPLRDLWLKMGWDMDAVYELRPYKYYSEDMFPLEEFKAKVKELYGLDVNWHSFAEFLDRIEKIGISVNHVPLVGHNTIRTAVMGLDHKRKSTESEIKGMKFLVAESMEAGAFGLSTGLDYIPGAYADAEEIVELVKVVKKYNGIYATHWRRTGIRRERTQPSERIGGVIEAVEVGRRTGVPVQVSHLASGYTIYPPPPPILQEAAALATLKVIDEAIEEGVDLAFDVIPNTSGGVFMSPYLVAELTPWLREAGSGEKLAEHLKMADFREEVKEVINSGKWWSLNPKIDPYWATRIKILVFKVQDYVGKTLWEIAEEAGQDSLDSLFDVVIQDPYTQVERVGVKTEAELIAFIKHPLAMIGIDTYAFDDKWERKYPPPLYPHPNTYGGFPRYLRRYVRELKVLTLEEAVRKVTSLPAQRFKLRDRGILREGAYADIVVFNYDEINDVGDCLEPRKYPKGIVHVLVNGKLVVDKGRHTGIKAGKLLRKVTKTRR